MISWNNTLRRILCIILLSLSTGFSSGAEAERPPSLRTRQKFAPDQGQRNPVETSNRKLSNNNYDNVFRASCSKRLSTGTDGDLSAYGQMFNVRRPQNAFANNHLSVTSFELYTDIIDPTMNVTYQLYSREGNYQTAKSDMRFWTLVASGTLQGESAGIPQVLPHVLDLPVSYQDGRAFYITLTTKDLIYNKGRGTQGDRKVQQANQDLEIWEGVGTLSYPAQNRYVIGPRMFLGALRYKTSPDCDDVFDNSGDNNLDGSSSSKVKLSFFSEHSNRFGLDKIVNGINENAKDALQEILIVDETLKNYALSNNLKIEKVESKFVPLDENAPLCIPSGTKTISETICSVVDTIATFSHTIMSESDSKALRETILSHGDGVMVEKIDGDDDFDNAQYIGVQITNDVVEIEFWGISGEMNSKEQQVLQEAFIKVLNPFLKVTEDIIISKATVINQVFSTAVRSRERQRRTKISTNLSPMPSIISRDPAANIQPSRNTRSLEDDDDAVGRNTVTIALVAESRPSDSSLKLIVTKALLNHEIFFLRFLKNSPEKEYFQHSYINDPTTGDIDNDNDNDNQNSGETDRDEISGETDRDADDGNDGSSNSKANIGAILGTVAAFAGVGVIGLLIFTGACGCFGLSTICWVSKKRKAKEQQRQEDRRKRLKHFAHRVSSRVLSQHPTRRNEKEQYEHEHRNSPRKDKLRYFSDMVSRRVFQVPPRSSGGSAARDAEQNTASSTVDTASKSLGANNARRPRKVEDYDSQASASNSSNDVVDRRGDHHTTTNPSKDLNDYNNHENEMNRSDHSGAKPRRGTMDMSTSSRGARTSTEGKGSKSEHNRRKPSMDLTSNQTDQLHRSDHHRPHARQGAMDMSTSSRGRRQRYDMKRPSMDTTSNQTDTSSLRHSSSHRDEEDFENVSPGRQRHSSTYQDHGGDRLNKSERQRRRSTMDNSFSYLDHKTMTSRSEHQRRKRPSMDFNPGDHHRASDAMNRSDHHRPRPSGSMDLEGYLDKNNDKEINRSGQASNARRKTMDMMSASSSRASSSHKGKLSEHRREVAVANSLDQADRERLNKSEHNHRRRPSMDMNSSGHQRSTIKSRPDRYFDRADRERLNKSEHNHRRRPSMDMNSSGHQRSTIKSRPDHSFDQADRERLNKSEHNHRRRPSMDMNSSGHQRSTIKSRPGYSCDHADRERLNKSEHHHRRRSNMDTNSSGNQRSTVTSRSEHRQRTTASMDIVDHDRMPNRDMKRSSRSEHRRRVSNEILDRDRLRGPMDTSTSGHQEPSKLESRSEHGRTTHVGAEDSNRLNQSERQPRRETMDTSTSSRNRRRHG